MTNQESMTRLERVQAPTPTAPSAAKPASGRPPGAPGERTVQRARGHT